MIEQILKGSNLLRAMHNVQKNHGSAGVDHMPVTKLSALLSIDREYLTEKVHSGKYLPQPILGVEIPKGNGKTRLLGIPTVTDRLLQQAVLQVITARFEFEFSKSSYGFRTILGFGFVPTYGKGEKGKYQLVVSPKSWIRLKQKLKTITRKTTPMSFDERIVKLNEVQRGWVNYFRMASIYNKLADMDGWIRNRLRYCIWSRVLGRRNPKRKGVA